MAIFNRMISTKFPRLCVCVCVREYSFSYKCAVFALQFQIFIEFQNICFSLNVHNRPESQSSNTNCSNGSNGRNNMSAMYVCMCVKCCVCTCFSIMQIPCLLLRHIKRLVKHTGMITCIIFNLIRSV